MLDLDPREEMVTPDEDAQCVSREPTLEDMVVFVDDLKKRAQTALTQKGREVLAHELPRRRHAATMAGIAGRNERLEAFRASMLKYDTQCVDTMLHNMHQPRNAVVLNAAQPSKVDLAHLP